MVHDEVMIATPRRLAASIRAGAVLLLAGLLLAWMAPAEARCPDDAAGGHAQHAATGQDNETAPVSAAPVSADPDCQPGGFTCCCPGMVCGVAALPQGFTVLAVLRPGMAPPPLNLGGGSPAESGPPAEPPRT
jgi:hypothetical protein